MDHKTTDNQLPDIKRLCGHRGLEITREYILSGVWSYNSAHKTTLKAMLADAHAGQFQVLAVWAADRLSRGGIEVLLSIVRELGERRVKVLSVPQPRLSSSSVVASLPGSPIRNPGGGQSASRPPRRAAVRRVSMGRGRVEAREGPADAVQPAVRRGVATPQGRRPIAPALIQQAG